MKFRIPVLFLSFSIILCSNIFASTDDYFLGLKALQKNQISSAKNHFSKGTSSSNSIVSKKSYEELLKLTLTNKKIPVSKRYYNQFKDEDSLCEYIKALYQNKKFDSVLQISQNISLKDSYNETILYYAETLFETDSPDLEETLNFWFSNRIYSKYHSEFIKNHKNFFYTESLNENSQSELILNEKYWIFVFRDNVYNKKYNKALELINNYTFTEDELTEQIASDIGKCLLYSSQNASISIQFLKNISNQNPELSFYTNFYIGKIFEKIKDYQSSSVYFKKATSSTEEILKYENALWYLFKNTEKYSTQALISEIEQNIDSIQNKEYFDDFFYTLFYSLMEKRDFKSLCKITEIIFDKATTEATSKYCYVLARLNHEEIIDLAKYTNLTEKQLLVHCLKDGNELYYTIMACNALHFDQQEATSFFYSKVQNKNFSEDPEVKELFSNYIKYKLPGYAVSDYSKYSSYLNQKDCQKLALFLQAQGKPSNKYYSQSMRIASKRFYSNEEPFTKEFVSLVFPRYFQEYVEQNCEEYNLNGEVFYALIRSESFFDPTIKSKVGANGLTQLMDSTAKDISKKLKIYDYDLCDPQTNLKFGAFYFAELYRRTENSYIKSSFSYNGGITRVRNWHKKCISLYGKELPNDIFLETIPFPETRDYGKKIITSAVFYGSLYYNKNFSQVIEEILE